MDVSVFFKEVICSRKSAAPRGVCSVCSAQPMVLRAAMESAAEYDAPVLIEATTNQVNQFGGYTGMRPADFQAFVRKLADECNFPQDRIILGGDHLGPFVWRDKPEAEAMALSDELVRAYVLAGFAKIHLDTSMRLADDDPNARLPDEVIARRGARLCKTAEAAYAELKAQDLAAPPPVYIIGSEVPTPGGPQEELDTVQPTSPEEFLASLAAFRAAFEEQGLGDAFGRIVAFVVQPGVEFTGEAVFDYDSAASRQLCAALDRAGTPLVFEGHSTDYQTPAALAQMVRDGIAILKVGPALTFALREGLFALEQMEKELLDGTGAQPSAFGEKLEAAMLADDGYWRSYYGDDAHTSRLMRRYSYFDRARYYLPQRQVAGAQQLLLDNLAREAPPLTPLVKQYMPLEYEAIRQRTLQAEPTALLLAHIKQVLAGYMQATCAQ